MSASNDNSAVFLYVQGVRSYGEKLLWVGMPQIAWTSFPANSLITSKELIGEGRLTHGIAC